MTFSLLQMQLGMADTLKTAGVGFVIVLVVLAFIAVLIMMISKIFSKIAGAGKKETSTKTPAAAPVAAPAVTAPAVVATPGYLHLEGVSEENAAVMSIL